MRFAFSDEQLALRDAVRELLEHACTPAQLRAAWTNESGRIPGLWQQLVEMGVIGMLAPEADGGLGLRMVDLVLVLEESGRSGVPEPVVETAALGVPLFGRTDVTVAAGHELVPWADSADVIVTRDGSFRREDAELIPHPSVDGSRRMFEVRGTPAPVAAGTLDAAFARAAVGVAAQQCGLSQRMLDLTAEYAKERRQFGVPIGSFQAVKHQLANARVALEFARPLVYRAAATGDPVHASMAKCKADDAALLTARAALQCHGAIGYTTEYDLHLYMKRAWALARSMGDGRLHRDLVGEAIL
ncbi:MAG TPA: acyl-CoA dehydrogenase family protein [Acidimicrobiia bacterium]|nr:acyl-CoA dehydrogenase family protein [Acidimicrobiia bacterium]